MLTSARFSGCFGRSGGRNDAVGHRDAEVKLVGLMFPPQERIDRRDSVQLSQIQSPRRDKDSRKHSSDRTAKAPPATVTVSNRTVTERVGTARPSATHSQRGGDFTVQHSIYTASGGGEGRQTWTLAALLALPHSQLSSRVDECEQTFIVICESTPQFSALQKTHCGGGACWQAPAAAVCCIRKQRLRGKERRKRGEPADGDLLANVSGV